MANKQAVIYLQKDKFQFYSPLLGSVLEFRFLPEMVRDLDVLNNTLIEKYIKVFVTNAKIPPSDLVIVLADNTYFIKDFVLPNQPQTANKTPNPVPSVTMEVLRQQADQFVEQVPFDSVVSKSFPLKDGIKVCATNKDFYESVAIAFEHLGFTLVIILPGLVMGNGLSAKPVMDAGMANFVLQKANTFREYNLLNQQVFKPEVEKEVEEVDEVVLENSQDKKPDKKRLFALVGVLFTLLVVLVIVYVQSQTPPSPPQQPIKADEPVSSTNQVNPLPTSLPTEALSSETSSTLQTQNLSVQLINASAPDAQVQALREQLNTYRFQSVTVQTQSSVKSANTQVSFSGNTSQAVRNAVLKEVRKIRTDITVQEKQSGTFDITILLGS